MSRRRILPFRVRGNSFNYVNDTHILDWLEQQNIEYDVLTDEDIDRQGASALGVDSDAKCNPVDSIGSSTKSRVSHSERRPSARFPGDEDGLATRNIEPLQ